MNNKYIQIVNKTINNKKSITPIMNVKINTKKTILGVKISSTSRTKLLDEIEKKVNLGTKFSLTTVGPEIILLSQNNNELKKALNKATFSIPDGFGLKLAEPDLEIIKGRELFLDLIKLANKNKWKVFLLGGLDDEAERTVEQLLIKHPKLLIQSMGGPKVTSDLSKSMVDKINKFRPDILFIAFSHPEQEIVIEEYLKRLNIKGVMTVGGTFNYIAGNSKLPPQWISSWGEWLWRLITEPKRIKRIFNATILFPIEVLKEKLRS